MKESKTWIKGLSTLVCAVVICSSSGYAGAPSPTVKQQPVGRTNNAGTSVAFTIKDTGSQNTYQWYKDGTNRLSNGGKISGATTASLTITNLLGADRGRYGVVVRNSASTVTSSNAVLWVWDPCITGQPKSCTNNLGSTASFAVTAYGTAPLSYQWLKNNSPISGATGATYSIAGVTDEAAAVYGVVVANTFGSVTSSPPALLMVITPPVIDLQPQDQMLAAGSTATFLVSAAGSPATYRWYKNGTNQLANGGNVSGAATPALVISNVLGADRAVYSATISNAAAAVTSSNAALWVWDPAMVCPPAGCTNNLGSTASFTVTAYGAAPLSYQWLKNDSIIAGATSETYAISEVTDDDTAAYSVIITNAYGAITSSPPALLKVLSPPLIVVQPESQTNRIGSTARFSVAAAGTAPMDYQWFIGGTRLSDSDHISGSTAATLFIADVAAADAAAYSVVITNIAGRATSAPPATLTLISPPTITSQPANQTNLAGTTASFTVSAVGTAPLFYLWFKNGSPLGEGGAISGTTTPTLNLTTVSGADAAAYFVVITNAAGAATSTPPAILKVQAVATAISIFSAVNPSGFQDPVQFTVSLPLDATGQVTFKTNDVVFDTATASGGTATSAVIAWLPRGNITISAEYAGDAHYAGSTNRLVQTVTNHPPVAATMTVHRTAGQPLAIRLLEVATNWSDADGDTLTLSDIAPETTNGASLTTQSNWFPNLDLLEQQASDLSANASLEPNTNEIWISTNAAGAHLGTRAEPFDGSSAEKFDEACRQIPPDTIIHLMPGTFQTQGAASWHLKSGQKLLGDRVDTTILQLVDTNSENWVLSSEYVGNNIEIADLTLDANGSPEMKYTRCGAILGGTQNIIRRVRLINCVTGSKVNEGWGLQIESYFVDGPSAGNIIEDCEISHYQGPVYTGGYFADLYAIVMHGGINSPISGVIRNNRILTTPSTPVFGIGFGRAHDVLIESNYLYGVGVGTHIENSDPMTNIVLAHNRFIGCTALIDMSYNHGQNIAYLYNEIVLTNGLWNFVLAFKFEPTGAYSNIVIYGNTIRCSASPGCSKNMFVEAWNLTGLSVINNCVDTHLANALINCTNITMFNNCDQNGTYPPALNFSLSGPLPFETADLDTLNRVLVYTNEVDGPDLISYGIQDGHGGTNIGWIAIVMKETSSPGTNPPSLNDILARLTFGGTPGSRYVMERTTNLAAPAWVAITTNTTASNGVIPVTDTFGDLDTPPPAAFYRIVWRRKSPGHALTVMISGHYRIEVSRAGDWFGHDTTPTPIS